MKLLLRNLFLIILAGILFLGNLTVYEALVLAFGLQTGQTHLILAVALGLLSVSFIVSLVIGRKYYNTLTRAFYWFSNIWIGIFSYFFITSLVYAVVALLYPPFVALGPWLFLASVLISLYGFIHAQQLVTKPVTVTLPHLPSQWKGRKLVWISDIHIGPLYGAAFAEKIVKHITSLAPDMIFVGGDLYDGTNAPDMTKLSAPLAKLSAPFGVYFITGNHEEYGDLKEFLSIVTTAGMRVLKDELVIVDGLQLIGVDYRTTAEANAFKEVLAKLPIDSQQASILLKHEPKDLQVAAEAGISFQISGHTHNAQLWPLTYIADMVHKGYAYGLKRFDTLQVYTSSGTGTWGPPMRVGTDGEIVLITLQ
ncbi:MAG: metallophosphoesterase [Parcubacteria group bacterium]|nr:metallophosphoesterase [Parcubacteria group bacterium]